MGASLTDQLLIALSHTALSHNLAIFRGTPSNVTLAPYQHTQASLSSQTLGLQEEAAHLLHSRQTGLQWFVIAVCKHSGGHGRDTPTLFYNRLMFGNDHS